MAEVKWTARRVSDGVLVDVTGDTDGSPQGAPIPNALESGGAGQVVQGAADEGGNGATVQADSATTNNGGTLNLSGGSGLPGKGGGGVLLGGGDGDGGADSGARITIEGGGGGADGRIEMVGDEVTFTIGNPPEIPATPNAQNIVDALVTLGLVTQAAP